MSTMCYPWISACQAAGPSSMRDRDWGGPCVVERNTQTTFRIPVLNHRELHSMQWFLKLARRQHTLQHCPWSIDADSETRDYDRDVTAAFSSQFERFPLDHIEEHRPPQPPWPVSSFPLLSSLSSKFAPESILFIDSISSSHGQLVRFDGS